MPVIFPAVESRRLEDTSPGDLVKVGYGSKTGLAFVAGTSGGDERHLVMLEDMGETRDIRLATALLRGCAEERVLWLGTSYRIDLDVSLDRVHSGWFRNAEMPGVVSVKGSEVLLRVGQELGSGRFRGGWYNFQSGLLSQLQAHEAYYVSAWSLGLEVLAGSPPKTLLRFAVD